MLFSSDCQHCQKLFYCVPASLPLMIPIIGQIHISLKGGGCESLLKKSSASGQSCPFEMKVFINGGFAQGVITGTEYKKNIKSCFIRWQGAKTNLHDIKNFKNFKFYIYPQWAADNRVLPTYSIYCECPIVPEKPLAGCRNITGIKGG